MQSKQGANLRYTGIIHLRGTFPVKTVSPHLLTGIESVEGPNCTWKSWAAQMAANVKKNVYPP